jgi:hypothetical protein
LHFVLARDCHRLIDSGNRLTSRFGYFFPQQVQAPQQSHVPQVHSEQSQASQSHLLQHVSHSQTSQVHVDLAAVATVSAD